MDAKQYLNELSNNLGFFSEEDQLVIINDVKAIIDESLKKGDSWDKIELGLGSPKKLGQLLSKDAYNDNSKAAIQKRYYNNVIGLNPTGYIYSLFTGTIMYVVYSIIFYFSIIFFVNQYFSKVYYISNIVDLIVLIGYMVIGVLVQIRLRKYSKTINSFMNKRIASSDDND